MMEFDLSYIIRYLPGFVYWKNTRSEYMGCNDNFLQFIGVDRSTFIGKTDHDFAWGDEYARNFKADDKEVMASRQPKITEHKLLARPEHNRYLWIKTEKRPLYNMAGQVIGVLAIATDITAQKDNERLTIENEVNQTQLQQQEQFRKIVGQVAHDIRSPLMGLSILADLLVDISEDDRASLREMTMRIHDIAINLLSHYQPKHTGTRLEEERKPLLVSLALLNILAEKRYQYHGTSVRFTTDFQPGCHFAFAQVEASAFRCMLSNIINNAVDAFDDRPGVVTLGFDIDDKLIKIDIRDNGKGMSAALVDKIINNITVTEGKVEGHGIGLMQVREMLQRNQGDFAIDSAEGKGTTIRLTFPRSPTPDWIAKQITVNSKDTVVILDDEPTIHNAWDALFAMKAPSIPLIHFEQADKALAFLNNVAEKENILLLTDYELLKQPYNGLDIIKETQVKRAVLVTSHYANARIQEQAVKSGAVILPKQLAPEIPILG